ncbi:PQ-loop repeat-containing protein [Myxococcota bacterium]|nr:PQ-loop repeat-containing protein [Myxococcota bacterium]
MNLYDLGENALGIFGTTLVVISYFPQIKHLFKMHCGEGVSLGAYFLWAASSALLCVYAGLAAEWVFTALQGYHAVACVAILLLGAKYRNSRCPAHQGQD